MIRPDLHLHTVASDGICTASQVARLVQKADVTLFSITDHDTMAALPEAAQAAYDRGLAFIPGVEISTEGEEEVHILGYGVKYDDPKLNAFFSEMAAQRHARVAKMGRNLIDSGFDIPLEEVLSSAGASVGRPHLGRAMIEKGYVSSVQEAFEKYLGKGRSGYIPRDTVPASQAISLLRSRGAVPVLAHPGELNWPMEKLLPMLRVWMDAGLQGLEVYHPSNRGEYSKWEALARKNKLLVTGGSDFHDFSPNHGTIGETASEWARALSDGWELYRAACRSHS